MPPRIAANPAFPRVAWTLLLDAAAAECVLTLRAEGVQTILLKGPVTARWLYSSQVFRPYTDFDLLVSPDRFPRALRTLEDIGYRCIGDIRDTIEGEHAVPLRLERPALVSSTQLPAGLALDLHWSFHGIGASDEAFWTIIAGDAERMVVSGTEVDVPSEPARALLVALHASTFQASVEQPLRDLERALEVLPDDTWRAAGRLAERLNALPRYAAGLSMRPLGLALVDRLGLRGKVDVRSALYAAGAPPVADAIVGLRTERGVGPRMRLLARGLVPTQASMRLHWRLARRGSLGLALAYVCRPFWLLAQLPGALRAYARARRVARADDLRDTGDPREPGSRVAREPSR